MPDQLSNSPPTQRFWCFRRICGLLRRHPRKALLVFRDTVLVAVTSFVFLVEFMWGGLMTDLTTTKLPAVVVSDSHPDVVPFEFLLYRVNVAVVIGLVAGISRCGFYYWDWRRQQGTLPERCADRRWGAGFSTGAIFVFVATSIGAYQFLLPLLADEIVTAGVFPLVTDGIYPYWGVVALVFCLACGVASLLVYAMTVVSIEGIEPIHTTVVSGLVACLGSLVFGYIAWPLGLLARYAWMSPLLIGCTGGLVFALTITKARRTGVQHY